MKELWIVLCFCIHSLFSFGQGGGSTSVLNDPSRNQNLHDSINKVKSLLFCSSLMGSAFILNKSKLFNIDQSIKSERDENYFKFRTKVDDYLQFAPILAGYVMGLSGDKSNLWYYTKRLFVTEAMIGILVPKLKTWSRVKNPNTDHYNAFPSGHTAQAFAAATLVSDHFCKKACVDWSCLWICSCSWMSQSFK